MLPVLFRLGPFEVDSFWAMVFLGFAAAAWAGRAEFVRAGLDGRFAYDLLLYAYVGGLVGARLFLVFTEWDLFRADPLSFLLSGSGWVWYGGLIGGTLAVAVGSRHLRVPFDHVAEAAGLALPLGQAIGRIGCLLAGDGDYGTPTALPWGMSFPNGIVPTTERVHPTPLYEATLYSAIFAVLWRRRGRGPVGESMGLYLALAGLARFAVEFVRRNPTVAMGLTLAQWISLASVFLGAAVIARLRVQPPRASGT